MYTDKFDGKIVNGSASWNAGGEDPWVWIGAYDVSADEAQETFDLSHDKH